MYLYVSKRNNIFLYSDTLLLSRDDCIFTKEGTQVGARKDDYDVVYKDDVTDETFYKFRSDKYSLRDNEIVYRNPLEEIQDKWDIIRIKRDALLKESDVLSGILWIDYWNGKDEQHRVDWTAYRQQLRDLPSSTENPDDIVWPTLPTENVSEPTVEESTIPSPEITEPIYSEESPQ